MSSWMGSSSLPGLTGKISLSLSQQPPRPSNEWATLSFLFFFVFVHKSFCLYFGLPLHGSEHGCLSPSLFSLPSHSLSLPPCTHHLSVRILQDHPTPAGETPRRCSEPVSETFTESKGTERTRKRKEAGPVNLYSLGNRLSGSAEARNAHVCLLTRNIVTQS